MAASTAGTFTLTTSPQPIYDGASDPMGRAKRVRLMNRSASSGLALISIAGLHQPTDFLPLAPGQWADVGGDYHSGFTLILAKSDGTASLDFGVTLR